MFKVYDIVSRMGEDEQIVTEVDDICMTVVCIKAGGCFRIGEDEYNLQRRYDLVRHGSVSDIPVIQDAEFADAPKEECGAVGLQQPTNASRSLRT